MNFEFSDDQNLLRDQAQGFLQRNCPIEAVRAVLEGDQAHDTKLWKGIVEMGWTATTIPENYGGIGLGHLELCVLAEELGRCLAPTPFSSSLYLATEVLLMCADDRQKQHWLPKLAEGVAIGTFALAEGAKPPSKNNIETRVQNGKISGCKIPVPDGEVADFAVVLAKDEAGHSLYLVELKDQGVTRRTVKSVDPSRSYAELSFASSPAEPLGKLGDGFSITDQLLNRAAILFAFEQVGGAQASLEMARQYTLERYAFGRPIASFQAIKHKLADMYIALTLAHSNCYYGAWALSNNAAELPLAAATARVSATEAFQLCAKENIQSHGGMGFTWEFNCHLYYRRAKATSLNLGSLNRWKELLVSHLLDSNNVSKTL
ncbi:MAG: acyl-CoA/acyl-ACP dehydrogenase [Pseudomonadales bacterium]|nr:acyl-CoA/acyl-ACP dehydrogenase [Pseudomonadales bacterium]